MSRKDGRGQRGAQWARSGKPVDCDSGEDVAAFGALIWRGAEVIAALGAEVGAAAAVVFDEATNKQNGGKGKEQRGEPCRDGEKFFLDIVEGCPVDGFKHVEAKAVKPFGIVIVKVIPAHVAGTEAAAGPV